MGVLAFIGGTGLKPLCNWRLSAKENDPNQIRCIGVLPQCGWRHCKYASSCVYPRAHLQHRPPAILGWKPWAYKDDENQAFKLPAASASCPIGGWRPWADGHDENQARKLLETSSGSSAASISRPSMVGWLGPMKTMRRHLSI